MIDFYNAFISYRHAPLDSKVAETLQRDLERFHVPHAIRRQTGRQKIERIFRDKDELPITSDLTETISDALTKAEYLIVICSPNTRESAWVPKEIEYFLKSHSRDKVLTVLAGGEPEDVIPDILKRDGDKIIEPLSCDYRLPARKAKKEELPRLAAALIGCSYDELVRRERAYKMKQFVAVSVMLIAAAVGFALYMMRSNRKVREAYLDSLNQQVLNLAREARLYLDKDRRLEALLISLVTVPSEDDPDIPITPEAISLMADATFAYQGLTEGSVDAVWDYYTGDIIEDYAVNPSGTKLVVMNYMKISMFSTDDHSVLFQLQDSFLSADSIFFIDDDSFVVVTREALTAYSADDGHLLWNYTPGSFYLDSYTAQVTDGGSVVIGTSEGSAILLSPDGNVENEFFLSDNTDSFYINKLSLSPDGERMAFTAVDNSGMFFIGSFDIASDETVLSDPYDLYPSAVTWTDDRHIAAAFLPPDAVYINNSETSYSLEPMSAAVCCYDASDMSLDWTVHHNCTFSNANCSFIVLGASGLLGFSCGDRLSVINPSSGSVEYSWDAGDTIVDVSDVDGDGLPVIITRSGGYVRPAADSSDSRTILSYEFQGDMIRAVANNDSFFIQPDQETVICYEIHVRDEQWEQTADLGESMITDNYIDDNVIALIVEDSDYNVQLALIDPSNNTLTARTDLGNYYDYSSFELLGVWNGFVYSVATNTSGIYLISTDITNGTTDTEHLSQVNNASYCSASMQDGYIVYLSGEGAYDGVGLYDIDADERQTFNVPIESSYVGMAPVYDHTLNIIYVQSDVCDYIVDVNTGDVISVDTGDDWDRTSLIYIDPVTEHILISDRTKILILDRTGNTLNEIGCESMMPVGFSVIDDPNYLMVVGIDGSLSFYDGETYESIWTVSLATPEVYVSNPSFYYERESGTLYVRLGGVLNGIEISSLTAYLSIENCIGYHAASDRFFTYSDNLDSGISVGFFRHYTFEDLLNRVYSDLGYL